MSACVVGGVRSLWRYELDYITRTLNSPIADYSEMECVDIILRRRTIRSHTIVQTKGTNWSKLLTHLGFNLATQPFSNPELRRASTLLPEVVQSPRDPKRYAKLATCQTGISLPVPLPPEPVAQVPSPAYDEIQTASTTVQPYHTC